MTDQEKLDKVINGLEMSYKYSNCDEDNTIVPQRLVLAALALLKAQEPIKAKTMTDGNVNNPAWWCVCGNCGLDIDIGDKYCRRCGRAVKWNG